MPKDDTRLSIGTPFIHMKILMCHSWISWKIHCFGLTEPQIAYPCNCQCRLHLHPARHTDVVILTWLLHNKSTFFRHYLHFYIPLHRQDAQSLAFSRLQWRPIHCKSLNNIYSWECSRTYFKWFLIDNCFHRHYRSGRLRHDSELAQGWRWGVKQFSYSPITLLLARITCHWVRSHGWFRRIDILHAKGNHLSTSLGLSILQYICVCYW